MHVTFAFQRESTRCPATASDKRVPSCAGYEIGCRRRRYKSGNKSTALAFKLKEAASQSKEADMPKQIYLLTAACIALSTVSAMGQSGGSGGTSSGGAGSGGAAGASTGSSVPSGTATAPAPTPGQPSTSPSDSGAPGAGQAPRTGSETSGSRPPGARGLTTGQAQPSPAQPPCRNKSESTIDGGTVQGTPRIVEDPNVPRDRPGSGSGCAQSSR